MTTRYRLHYAPDNASLIIRLVLEELGQPYKTVLVDRKQRAHKSPDYLRLNPQGLIPVLETPDGPVFETGAILLWLADRHGALAPLVGTPERAPFLKWLFFTANTVHVAMRMTFYPDQYIGPDTQLQRALRCHMQGVLPQHLDALEEMAAQQPGWFGATSPSVLDFYVACLMRWMVLYPQEGSGWFSIGNWPHLKAMAARLEPCGSVQSAIDAEGLGPTPFTAPQYARPPEGSAT
ncbi:glutathione S-transferase family protein [uncultured Roseovarius sp.]|uniref:glutathione S-transferase family protein n=1 Tax=uncultured Roseovarius sp. TaxID=293344 RepID=UPI00261EE73A|nr:glutathione S-transferase family protein [uncultured Roseovarius sp.]